MNSDFLTLNWKDLLKGAIVAAFGGLVAGIAQGINTGTFDYKAIGMGALSGGIGYLMKNFIQNNNGEVLKK